jgi:hypothetical protein
MQKKQKIKENPIAPRVFPCQRTAKAVGQYFYLFMEMSFIGGNTVKFGSDFYPS